MLGFLKLLIVLPIAVVLILIAVANRAPVILSFDPFSRGAPELAVSVPLWALLFGCIALGMLIGGTASWLGSGANRRAGRKARRESRVLREEAERLRANVSATRNPALPKPT